MIWNYEYNIYVINNFCLDVGGKKKNNVSIYFHV